MKKKLLFTLLALIGCIGAWAQLATDGSKYYYIIEKSTGRYAAFGVEGAEGAMGLQPEGTKGDFFKFTVQGDGRIKIQNQDAKTLGVSGWNTANNAEHTWVITEGEGEYAGYYRFEQNQYNAPANLNYQAAHTQSLYTDSKNLAANIWFQVVETYYPSLPANASISVSETKANTFTAATAANDNAHWYVMTQTRNGVSPMYDDNGTVRRAASGATVGSSVAENAKYLIRFISTTHNGVYKVQFGNGKYANVAAEGNTVLSTTTHMDDAAMFFVYNIDNQDTHIGWNVTADGETPFKPVDNNGAGQTVQTWSPNNNPTILTSTGGNTDWSIYPVEFSYFSTINYTVTDQNGAQYSGSYEADWAGNETATPSIPGAYGATFTNVAFTENAGVYSMTATIDFGFPVSSNDVDNATGLQSQLGNSKWFANGEDKVLANNEANTKIYTSNVESYKWLIIPSFADGAFSFKLKNVGAGKYIPANASTGPNNATTLVDEANAGSFYFCHINTGNGFATSLTSNKFLTINSSATNQNIWIWQYNAGGGHQGSNMSFPEISATVNDEQVNEEFAALAEIQKFNIVEGATVISPSEYAAPAQINAAIDACQAVEDNVEAKVEFLTSDDAAKLRAFKNASTSYGAPLEFTWTIKANKWGTLFSPVNFTKPADLTLYTCAGASDEGVLTLAGSGSAKNKPFLVKNTADADKTYQIIGYANGAATQNTTVGLLTGVIEENSKVPAGSYILATQGVTQAFYRVDTDQYTAAVNKCYITMPGGATPVKALYFSEDGVETAIEGIDAETVNGAIYNLSGQKLSKLQKGINIVNGKKIMVK